MKLEVFISYHSDTSSDIARNIVDKLEERGIGCWFAERDSVAHYAGAIIRAIEKCSVVVVLVNKEASFSRHILTETSLAFNNEGKSLVPFMLPGHYKELSHDMQYYLETVNRIDGRTPEMSDRIDELVDYVCAIVNKTPLPQKESLPEAQEKTQAETHSGPKVVPTATTPTEIIKFDSGACYEGSVKDGKPNGKGKMKYSNGSVYTGEWQNGMRHGKGSLHFSNGDVYKGGWNRDMRHGKGTFAYSDGELYEGEFKSNKRHGFGKCTYFDKSTYEGQWSNGKRHGKGNAVFANGDTFEGEWAEDEIHGYGRLALSDGEEYKGEFREGKFNGKGRYIYRNGDVYTGYWFDGTPEGSGDYIFSNKDTYSGEFSYGKFHGSGAIFFSGGTVYETELLRNKYYGKGSLSGENRFCYRGTWTNGKPNGKGIVTDQNGDTVYEGDICSGRFHGKGRIVDANGTVQECIFKNGTVFSSEQLRLTLKRKPISATNSLSFSVDGHKERFFKQLDENGKLIKYTTNESVMLEQGIHTLKFKLNGKKAIYEINMKHDISLEISSGSSSRAVEVFCESTADDILLKRI